MKHVIAKLRNTIGLSQPRFAAMIGRSLPTVQNIEYGNLKLSVKLAVIISYETGVNVGWLLSNNHNHPIITSDREPWTIDHFNETRRLLFKESKPDPTEPTVLNTCIYNSCG